MTENELRALCRERGITITRSGCAARLNGPPGVCILTTSLSLLVGACAMRGRLLDNFA